MRGRGAWLFAAGLATAVWMATSPAAAGPGLPSRSRDGRHAQAATGSADSAEVGNPATLVPFGTMTAIIVWRSPEAMQDGIALAKANAPAIEVYPLVSCIAESGAKVVIVEYGPWDKHYVVSVTDGPHAGCRGAVLNLNVKR
jgi:hypothetical protein